MQNEQLCKSQKCLEAFFFVGHADTSAQPKSRFKVGRAQRPGKEVPGHAWPSRSCRVFHAKATSSNPIVMCRKIEFFCSVFSNIDDNGLTVNSRSSSDSTENIY